MFFHIGMVFSFDEDGVTESQLWECCLSLKIATSQDLVFSKQWDASLHHHSALPKWQKHLYVLSFLSKVFISMANA